MLGGGEEKAVKARHDLISSFHYPHEVRYYYPPFIDEEIEDHKNEVTSPRSLKQMANSKFELKLI